MCYLPIGLLLKEMRADSLLPNGHLHPNYGFHVGVFNQVPEVKNGRCGGLAGTGVFGAKWPFALVRSLFLPSFGAILINL